MLNPQECQEKDESRRRKDPGSPPAADLWRRHQMLRQQGTDRQSSQQPANVSRVVDSNSRQQSPEKQIVAGKSEETLQRALHCLFRNRQTPEIERCDQRSSQSENRPRCADTNRNWMPP